MTEYLYQIVLPGSGPVQFNWLRIYSTSPKDAAFDAIEAFASAKGGHSIVGQHRVWVSLDRLQKHPNGEPVFAHAIDLEVTSTIMGE